MIDNVMIYGPKLIDEEDRIIKITDLEEKEAIQKKIKENDNNMNVNIEGSTYLNDYENDDYIYVSEIIESVRQLHKITYYNSDDQKWIRGYSEIPYIHLVFYEKGIFKKDENGVLLRDENGVYVSDDSKLNMSITPNSNSNCYNLNINYYWLKQYLKFLHKLFDDNEEICFELPEEQEINVSYSSKEFLLKKVSELYKEGRVEQANGLKKYIDSFIDETKIPTPILLYYGKGKNQKSTWSFYNKEQHAIFTPLKKEIYNTTGFASHFYHRNSLIYDIFENSLKMLIAHEVAHVARGHWNLRLQEPEYSHKRNVMMNCEIQADHTAARWLINELIYETVNDDPYYPVIAYSREGLIYNWAIRIFSAYLALSWGFREDERLWDIDTVNDFCNKSTATHPIYQFRTYCVLNHLKDHLDHMAKESIKEDGSLYTSDGNKIDIYLLNEVWSKSMDMILSFEDSFNITWNKDGRSIREKLNDNLKINNLNKCRNVKTIPFMIGYMKKAQDELNEYEKEWPEILKKLRKYGMYYVM